MVEANPFPFSSFDPLTLCVEKPGLFLFTVYKRRSTFAKKVSRDNKFNAAAAARQS